MATRIFATIVAVLLAGSIAMHVKESIENITQKIQINV